MSIYWIIGEQELVSSGKAESPSARVDLHKPGMVRGGAFNRSVPLPQCDLAAQVRRLLVQKRITSSEVDLGDLHLHVPVGMQVSDEYGFNQVTKAFYDTDAGYGDTYLEIIRYLAAKVFPFEFLFQATPTVRFHFPVRFHDQFRTRDGRYLGHHTDALVGHALEEINCWMPLADCSGSAALQIAPLEESIELTDEFARDIAHDVLAYHDGRAKFVQKLLGDEEFQRKVVAATKPLPMRYGELLVFDSRCLHATAENCEKKTRISIDFRVIPLAAYERLDRVYMSAGRSKRRFVRGDIFAERSSADVLRSSATAATFK